MSYKILLWCFVCLISISRNYVTAINEHCTSNSGCLRHNEVCSKVARQCQCQEGTRWFADKCHGISQYEDNCQDQFECSQSRDAHLHCLRGTCQCGGQRIYNKDSKKCEQVTTNLSQNKYNFNKMIPRKPNGNSVELDDKYKDIKLG